MKSPLIQKILKYSIIGGFTATVFGFVTLLTTNTAHAFDLFDVGSAVADVTIGPLVNILFIGIPYGVGFVGSLWLKVAAYCVSWLFTINTQILPDQLGIIEIGYKISLSVANLLFVIALIAIAFATIFNVQEYSAKKKLGQLIVTAITVNFGLLIVGFLLDISHIITNFFLSGGQVGEGLAAALGPSRFMVAPFETLKDSFAIFQTEWWTLVAGNIMLSAFTWILFIVMAAVAGMFLWRYIKLVGLIIVLPFVWAVDLIPGGQGKKAEWWHEFIQAAFFLPGASFFIYLAIIMATKISELLSTPNSLNITVASGKDLMTVLPQLVLQLAVVIGILQYGMALAQKMGGDIAKKGIALSRRATDPILNRATKATKGIYGATLKTPFARNTSGKNVLVNLVRGGLLGTALGKRDMSPADLAAKTGSGIVDKIHGNKTLNELDTKMGSPLKAIGRKIQTTATNYEAEVKKIEDAGHDYYHDILHDPPTNPARLAALTKIAAKEGDIGDLAKNLAAQKGLSSPDAADIAAEFLANNYVDQTPAAREKREKDDTLRAIAGQNPDNAQNIVAQGKNEFIGKLSGDEARQWLNMAKYDSFRDSLSKGQKVAVGRKNGESESVINRGEATELANLSTASADASLKSEGGLLNSALAKMYGDSATGATGIKDEIKALKEQLVGALNKKDTAEVGRLSGLMEAAQKQFIALKKEQVEIVRRIEENPEAKKDPQIMGTITTMNEIARGIGAGGVREKAEKSHHAEAGGKSPVVDFTLSGEISSGGGHGGGGGGHH